MKKLSTIALLCTSAIFATNSNHTPLTSSVPTLIELCVVKAKKHNVKTPSNLPIMLKGAKPLLIDGIRRGLQNRKDWTTCTIAEQAQKHLNMATLIPRFKKIHKSNADLKFIVLVKDDPPNLYNHQKKQLESFKIINSAQKLSTTDQLIIQSPDKTKSLLFKTTYNKGTQTNQVSLVIFSSNTTTKIDLNGRPMFWYFTQSATFSPDGNFLLIRLRQDGNELVGVWSALTGERLADIPCIMNSFISYTAEGPKHFMLPKKYHNPYRPHINKEHPINFLLNSEIKLLHKATQSWQEKKTYIIDNEPDKQVYDTLPAIFKDKELLQINLSSSSSSSSSETNINNNSSKSAHQGMYVNNNQITKKDECELLAEKFLKTLRDFKSANEQNRHKYSQKAKELHKKLRTKNKTRTDQLIDSTTFKGIVFADQEDPKLFLACFIEHSPIWRSIRNKK